MLVAFDATKCELYVGQARRIKVFSFRRIHNSLSRTTKLGTVELILLCLDQIPASFLADKVQLLRVAAERFVVFQGEGFKRQLSALKF